jgi:flagellar basal-body rod protein FlgB
MTDVYLSAPSPSMMDTPEISALSRFLDVTVFRNGLITSNLANIDTPHYRTRDINFRQELDRAEGEFQYAEYTPVARQVRGLLERPDGNNVSLERETLQLAESQLHYNIGVQLLRDWFHTLSSAIHEGGTS